MKTLPHAGPGGPSSKNAGQGLPGKYASLQASAPSFKGLVTARESRGAQGPHAPCRPSSARTVPERRPAKSSAGGHAPVGLPDPLDPLDPSVRQAAHMAPPPQAPTPASCDESPGDVQARTSLEDLLPALVRKVAWSGDGRRGTVRLELGAGSMAGAQVIVESDEGRVRVQLRAPSGVDAEAWRRRVAGRLGARGLNVEDIEAE